MLPIPWQESAHVGFVMPCFCSTSLQPYPLTCRGRISDSNLQGGGWVGREPRRKIELVMMSDARSTEGLQDGRRQRRRMSRGQSSDDGNGVWSKFLRFITNEQYINDEGYLIDPREVNMGTKIIAAALSIAVVMAMINPPPFIPRSYLHQGGLIGGGHRDLIQTAAGQARLWGDLTGKEKAAAEILGYDQETWDSDGLVAVDRLEWSKLTPVQRNAADALAIDKELWNSELFVDIYERSWSELTAVQKDDAQLLGFDKLSWDEEKHVWSDDVYWRQLTLDQQHAGERIGYTQEEWDTSRHIYDRSWDSLSDVQRESAGVLGYNKNKWNSDRYVRADDLYWKQLNDKQRKAARVLGFKQQEWDRATRAGSHSKDIDMERKRNLRKKQSKTECDANKSSCKGNKTPFYVPTIVKKERVRHTFPFGMR